MFKQPRVVYRTNLLFKVLQKDNIAFVEGGNIFLRINTKKKQRIISSNSQRNLRSV